MCTRADLHALRPVSRPGGVDRAPGVAWHACTQCALSAGCGAARPVRRPALPAAPGLPDRHSRRHDLSGRRTRRGAIQVDVKLGRSSGPAVPDQQLLRMPAPVGRGPSRRVPRGGAARPPLVLVTPSPTTESGREVAALATGAAPVLMSSEAWHAYRGDRGTVVRGGWPGDRGPRVPARHRRPGTEVRAAGRYETRGLAQAGPSSSPSTACTMSAKTLSTGCSPLMSITRPRSGVEAEQRLRSPVRTRRAGG